MDGKIHDFQRDYDEHREEILINCGLRVLRIKNEEMKDLYAVLKRIKDFIF